MNKPVTRSEMDAFKADPQVNSIGGKTLMGFDPKTNKPILYPNRKERRNKGKKLTNNRTTTDGRKSAILLRKTGNVDANGNNIYRESRVNIKPYNDGRTNARKHNTPKDETV